METTKYETAQSHYTSSYKKYTDSSRSSTSCQKYADSYKTAPNNRNDDIDSHFNLDHSFDLISHATEATKATADLDNRRVDKENRFKAREEIRKIHDSDESDKELDVDNEHTLTNESDSGLLDIDLTLLKFEEFKIEFGALPTVNFEEIFSKGQKFRLFLTQIHSPYKFWFQFKEHEEHINTLMSALEYD